MHRGASRKEKMTGIKYSRIQAIILAVVGTTSLCFAGPEKLAKDLRQDSDSPIDVIVQFTQAPTAKHHARVTGIGGQLKADLSISHAGLYSIPASALEDLANDPDVKYISPDRPVQAM